MPKVADQLLIERKNLNSGGAESTQKLVTIHDLEDPYQADLNPALPHAKHSEPNAVAQLDVCPAVDQVSDHAWIESKDIALGTGHPPSGQGMLGNDAENQKIGVQTGDIDKEGSEPPAERQIAARKVEVSRIQDQSDTCKMAGNGHIGGVESTASLQALDIPWAMGMYRLPISEDSLQAFVSDLRYSPSLLCAFLSCGGYCQNLWEKQVGMNCCFVESWLIAHNHSRHESYPGQMLKSSLLP